VNVLLRDDSGAALDEHGQQIEGLPRELDLVAAARDAARGGIEQEIPEGQRHQANRDQYQRWSMGTQ
jgi:hypothetical protein